jgi:hypothetical protein
MHSRTVLVDSGRFPTTCSIQRGPTDYSRSIEAELAARQKEIDTNKPKLILADVYNQLTLRSYTATRLAVDMSLPAKIVRTSFKILAKQGKIRIKLNRGEMLAWLS